MEILIAEDDATAQKVLENCVRRWGYEPRTARNGAEACDILLDPKGPDLAILDCLMPVMNGLDVCRKVRGTRVADPPYLILLTGKDAKEDVVCGLEAGADDYLTKPFHNQELHARIKTGVRLLNMRMRLSDRIKQLEDALLRIKILQGLLPMCAWCKKVRNDSHYWQQVETYISEHSDIRFTHCICPDCLKREQAKITGKRLESAGMGK
ncbi:MAG: response regulator transcription factor [Planctomycetes bacterium]|nr:response regulator transcription factor [Planctomycetota bacterium]